jgi:hypothetical protein
LFTALSRLIPDSDPDELLLDVADDRIWISEATAGGTGLITRIADTLAQHPQDFDLQMQDTVQNCDREQLAIQLRAVADLINQNQAALQTTFAAVRGASDLPQQATTRRQLANLLEDAGIAATRDLIVGSNTNFLRPKSGPDSDALVAVLARHWAEEEARLGCAIDVRVMAVAARKIPEVDQQLRVLLNRIGGAGTTPDESQVFNLLQSLLWLSCVNSCPDCIEQSPRYQELARPSRALLLVLLDFYTASIRYDDSNWLDEVRTRLTAGAQANIWCAQDQLESCKTQLLDLLTAPIDVGFQLFYPTIVRITRHRREWVIHLAIRELIRN